MKHLERGKKERGRRAADQAPDGTAENRLEAGALLSWYDRHRRDLPWREDRDPYRILVSEVMLQQTRAEVVIPRYREFLRAFPTVESLASASRERVHQQWSGLGYYRRADRLYDAARTLVHRGGFPRTAAEWKELPGVGAYTSAAVASIAFDECVAVLDGNVERVLARWTCEEEEPRRAAPSRRLRSAAEGLLDPARPGDSNQALMELGALVCTPSAPDCGVCPLATSCCALRVARQEELPRRPRRRSRRRRTWTQFAVSARVHEEDRMLLVRRDRDSRRLAGLWELPGFVADSAPHRGEVRERARRWSLAPGAELGRFPHSITDTDYEVVLLAGAPLEDGGGGVREDAGARWVPLAAFDEDGRWTRHHDPLPTSSLLAKAIRLLRTR